MTNSPLITVICGGVGAARFLRGLIDVVDPTSIRAIVNVADDMVLHGLAISPDLDTVTYTLADAIDPERGWGLRNETWSAMDALGRYGERNWFSLGDQDIATHLQRTARLHEGATLTQVTAEITRAWGIDVLVMPVSNDRVSTAVTLRDSGEEISFQEYFVGLQHGSPISKVRFRGIEQAEATPEAVAAIAEADVVIIAPSNPIVSIDPVLSVPGIRQALADRIGPCVAISPIVGGKALKGPAANMMSELGHSATAAGVATLWSDLIDILLIDDADSSQSPMIAKSGVTPFVTDTIMATPLRRSCLARATLSAATLLGGPSWKV